MRLAPTLKEQPQNKIDEDRRAIDAIDRELLSLLNRRCEHARRIGVAKRQTGIEILQTSREQQIHDALALANGGPLGPSEIVSIWNEIFAVSRRIQWKNAFGYLGPRGTYSEDAARLEFGVDALLQPFDSIDAVFEAVSAGALASAVVPVENSTEGIVARTLDLISEARLPVTGEVILPILHCLLSQARTLEDIECVLGHPQALAQCKRWLDRNLPGVERRPMASNAHAASVSAATPTYAAIAGERAAALYDLGLMHRGIQDESINSTRFFVIGGQPKPATGSDATLVLAELQNTAGSLARLLAPLNQRGISVLRIETRPVRTSLWSYRFFLEFAAHQQQAAAAEALGDMARETSSLFVAGSYPRHEVSANTTQTTCRQVEVTT